MRRNSIRTLSSFEKRWMKVFADGIAKKDIEQYVTSTGNYIWHVFSWKLLTSDSFMIGDEARKAFDTQDKTDARYYEPWPVDGSHEPAYQSPTAAELDELTECYVVAADESWTYIKTHENGLCVRTFIIVRMEAKCEKSCFDHYHSHRMFSVSMFV